MTPFRALCRVLLLLVTVLAVAAGSLLATGTGPAGARQPDRAFSLTLLDQDPWVIGRGTFHLRLGVVAPAGGGTVEVTLHAPVTDATAILAGTEPTSSALRRVAQVTVQGGASEVGVALAVVPDADGTPGDPLVLGGGVSPLRIELIDDAGEVRQRAVTHLVHVLEGTRPIPLAVVVPFGAEPDRSAAGRARLDAAALAELRAPLEVLAGASTVPHTVDVRPETVSALFETQSDAARSVLQDLGAASAAPSEALGGPFVALDASAWVASGLGGMVDAELDTGFTTLLSVGLSPRLATVSLTERPSPGLLQLLAARNVNRVVVPAAADSGPLGRGALTVTGSPVTAIEVATVAPSAPDNAVEDAHHLLAALVLGAVAPGPATSDDAAVDRGRAIELRGVDEGDRTVLRVVLDALSRPGPLRPTTVDGLAARASEASGVTAVAQLRSEPVPGLDPSVARIPAAVGLLSSLGTVLDRQDVVADLGGSLLIAAGKQVGAGTRDALIGRVTSAVDAVSAAIIVPDHDTIAVTAHETTLPFVIRNDSEATLRVSLRLSSNELEFVGPNPLELTLEPGTTDVEVPIRTRRSGEFDLTARLTSPDGALALGDTRWTVRSRAIPGGGLVLTVGAAAFLVLWWLRHIRRSRRERQETPPPAALAAAPREPKVEVRP